MSTDDGHHNRSLYGNKGHEVFSSHFPEPPRRSLVDNHLWLSDRPNGIIACILCSTFIPFAYHSSYAVEYNFSLTHSLILIVNNPLTIVRNLSVFNLYRASPWPKMSRGWSKTSRAKV